MPLTSPNDPARLAERMRLAALRSYHLDGASPEAAFDHVVRLAAALFGVPIALVSFVEERHLLLKGRVGLAGERTPRDASFCAQAILEDGVLVVPDARADARFADNPLVTGEPFIRFYAGAPIVTPRGCRIGSVCVIDTVPRPPFTERQRDMLNSLAQITMDHLELRRRNTLRQATMRMAAATPDAIVCCDGEGDVTFWNASAERIFGFARAEIMGRPFTSLLATDAVAAYGAWMERVSREGLEGEAGRTLALRGRRADGGEIPIEISVATWREGEASRVGAIVRDLSERMRVQERLRHLTHFDGLTDLPNRPYFLERVDEALQDARPFCVLDIGLDRFRSVNGTMGLSAGDRVLVAAARRIAEAASGTALVARIGADEFGVLLTAGCDLAGADALARRVIQRLSEPFAIATAPCRLGASIGGVTVPAATRYDSADHVLRCALLALQQAKLSGGGRFEPFRPRLGQQADARRLLDEELLGAQDRGEFELHFQPQVSMPDGLLIGAEALLRWRHPTRGLLSPGDFLQVLETGAGAVPVGRWVVAEACAFAARMSAAEVPIRVGLNLFAAQLRDDSLFDDVVAALDRTGLPGRLLELELTETTVLGLDESVIATLGRLRSLGVKLAFDDYGTGYASLSLLKRYPLTRLKIDRDFVRNLQSDPDDAAIVRAVIALGGSLGLDIIAEGIETPEQATALVALGCREAQGYLFGRPMPAPAFLARYAAPA